MTEITRIVADADVLAADLLIGGGARDALDIIRSHSWIELVASDPLLDDAHTIIAMLATDTIADDWREAIETERLAIEHPSGDHPALASAYHGEAAHILSFDARLQSATTGVMLKQRVETSVKDPDAFARLFDPEQIHAIVFEEPYPGPDRNL